MEKVTVASELIQANQLLPNLAIAPQVNLSLVPTGETDVLLAKIDGLTKEGKPNTDYLALFLKGVEGRGVNELLFSFAPAKDYGRDTNDLLTDWRSIDDEKGRRRRHEEMGVAWSAFQETKPTLWRMVQRDVVPTYYYAPSRYTPIENTYPHPIPEPLMRFFGSDQRELIPQTIYPLLRWRVAGSNQLEFNFGQPDMEIYDIFRAQADKFFPEVYNGTNYPPYLNSVVGFWTLVHLSGGITKPWEIAFRIATYSADCGEKNVMSATQSGVLALVHADQFTGLAFRQNAQDFLDRTGITI